MSTFSKRKNTKLIKENISLKNKITIDQIKIVIKDTLPQFTPRNPVQNQMVLELNVISPLPFQGTYNSTIKFAQESRKIKTGAHLILSNLLVLE